jgi:hypothetical protein
MPKLTPLQLAGLSLFGVLIAASFYLLPLHALGTRRALIALLPFALGIALYALSLHRLRKSIKQQLWTDQQIAPLLRITSSMLFQCLGFVCLGLFFLSLLAPHAYRAIGWSSWLLGMWIMQLQSTVQRPKPPAGPRINWRTRPPIQSDHWGQP